MLVSPADSSNNPYKILGSFQKWDINANYRVDGERRTLDSSFRTVMLNEEFIFSEQNFATGMALTIMENILQTEIETKTC